MSKDDFGDRMKMYEGIEAERILIPGLPICVRLDGRAFHTFTRGLKRPYDERLSRLMIETTKKLVEETHAVIGYTQSDEISLIYAPSTQVDQVFFGGRVSKLVSTLTSIATAHFNEMCRKLIPEKGIATFDCRVWTVPSKEEAVNCLLWRELDATKNSVSMASSAYYSHNFLNGKNGSEKQELLFQKGINWNDYPIFFKRGTYVKRVVFSRKLTTPELDKLPIKHTARENPDMEFTRSEIRELDMPIFRTIINKVEVVFDGATPIMKD
jgi:tRNA(His) 5'-end guanylyltransferase